MTRPRYHTAINGETTLHHGSAIVPLRRTRGRRDPHLSGLAPSNLAYYRAIAKRLTPADRVWDVGCGSGEGLALLAEHCPALGIEAEAEARQVTSVWYPELNVVASPLEAARAFEPTVVTLVDVLSFQLIPRKLLDSLFRHVRPGTLLVVVEPQILGQPLLPPIVRSRTADELAYLIEGAGFALQRSVQSPAGCAIVEAVRGDQQPPQSQDEEEILAAERAIGEGNATRAAGLLLALLDKHHRHPRASSLLAQLALLNGELSAAHALCDEASRDFPRSIDVRCTLALCLETVDPDAAYAHWAGAQLQAPGEPEVALEFARQAAALDHPRTALAALERARAALQGRPEFHEVVSTLLAGLGRTHEARLEALASRSSCATA